MSRRTERTPRSFRGAAIFLAIGVACTAAAMGRAGGRDAIEGVRVAALDQPRISLMLGRGANDLEANRDSRNVVEAFLDTGASGCVLSSSTAGQFGVKELKTGDGKAVSFEDVGVGGAEKFAVSEPVYAALAPYPSHEGTGDFGKSFGPLRMQVRPEDGILAMIAPGMDIVGMPMMAGKVVVMDPSGLSQLDMIRTSVVAPGDRSIPRTTRHVPLTYVAFDRFTRVTPDSAPRPSTHANPMIGPDPFGNDAHDPVVITHRGKTARGTFLLDTGAATSMISTRIASQLGIHLDQVAEDEKISLAVSGVGGQKQSEGLYFDRLELPTREGKPIAYVKAPLLIADITVADEQGQQFTLDGVLGMNYLVASAEVSGGLLPDIGNTSDGPFRWIVIDHARGELGLERK